MTAKRPVQMRISVPGGIPEGAETNVPCPVCKTGMVPATIARAVKELLEAGADGPPAAPPSMPRLDTRPPLVNTDIMPTLAPRADDSDHDEVDD